ncbi:Poly [ADP-ribose] polymerase 12 [Portunus trituberculatus]|uniref:Poly [ADP-ribose] polymerase 12 n=1 Tax=Portunus trituberculatus TaxID=210409 RepID=A0A5B7CWU9_PORTR|nr:Poly [ADP-ribose] polymerase 12 [Portunus trituberculatus]
MDLSRQGSQQHGYPSPPNQPFNHPGPPNQGYHHYGPPDQEPPYQPPPGQIHYHQGPPGQGHYHQGPPGQGHYHQGPPGQGHHHQCPPGQELYHQGPPGQETYHPRSYSEGPPNRYPPAPPSYEESMGQYDNRPQPLMQDNYKRKDKAPNREASKSAHAQELVKALAMFEGQMADSEVISRQIESSVEEVEKVVRQRKDLFAYIKDGNKMMVELVPNIKLCTHYLSENGCTARDSCQALHICRNFIVTRCDLGPSCMFGHKFNTNHNNSVLSKLYLDLIKTHNLLLIVKKICRGNAPPRVCGYYSTKDGCRKKDNCKFLHICKDYVMNDGKCSAKNCPFNHQLTNKQCKAVLAQHGMSTNESIRDILLKVKQVLERGGGRHSSPAPKQDKKKEEQEESEDSQYSSDSDSCKEDTADALVKKKTKKTHGKAKEKGSKSKGKKATIKSTDFCGDVEIPEICIYSVNNKCMNEKKGCKYLHAKSLFHWQVEKDKKWYNFCIFQSKALESAYRDVSKNSITMPNIDTTKLVTDDKNILEILGPNTWRANFRDMCISDPTGKQLKIRRVSTPSSALSGLPQATVYDWYFEDEQGKWIRYGNVNSSGKQDFVCNITSEDIEKQYVTDSFTTMVISNNRFKYKIDFAAMTQTNLSSSKVREIRRRPIRLAYQNTATTTAAPAFATSASSDISSLPAYWQPMKSLEPYKLVTLDSNSTEFQDVCKSIKLMIPTAKICEVRRLQNEYLWRLFQYKKTDLANWYDELTMNVQKLYHGTDPDFINAICKENIDGRRYANTKDKYGKGTYFSNSSAVARTYCTPDTQGHLFMILADVIIGYMTLGNKNLNKPPLNSLIDKPYDTTVDSMTAPTIFVKYYKEEYYPEYIIEFIA